MSQFISTVGREAQPKPNPDGILQLLRRFGAPEATTVMARWNALKNAKPVGQ